MGCDIHGWVERKLPNGRWVAVSELRDQDRIYERFAKLAGVRGAGPDHKGVPDDVSDTAKYHIDQWGSDGHSHSYLPLNEAALIFKETGGPDFNMDEAFGVHPELSDDLCPHCNQLMPMPDYRLVFWFDN